MLVNEIYWLGILFVEKESEEVRWKVDRKLFMKIKIFYFCQPARGIEVVQQRIIGPARQKNPPPVLLCPTRGRDSPGFC